MDLEAKGWDSGARSHSKAERLAFYRCEGEEHCYTGIPKR